MAQGRRGARIRRLYPAILAAAMGLAASPAGAVLINNGVTGDGAWSVDVLDGGETRSGNLDPTGPLGSSDIIFDYFHYVDVGADGGAVRLSDTTITQPATLSGGEVVSRGEFAGENGTVSWTARSRIPAGSTQYLTELVFESDAPFGTLRLIQYLDEDVFGVSDDLLVVLGTPGAADFQLLTVDGTDNVGISHAAGYLSAVGMSYVGWAADRYANLKNLITGPGASFSVAGVVDTTDLVPTSDARYPGLPVYGPADITSAIAFDLDPTATYASVLLSLGGAPSGSPPPPPDTEPNPVPAPGTLLLLGIGAAGLAWRRRHG